MKKNKKSIEKEEKKKAVEIGIGSGIIAALCCLGPAFIVSLGLSSLSVALALTQFQPYFIALSLIFMISTIWLYLRKKNNGRCDLHTMKRNKSFIGITFLVMLIFYATILYIVMPAVTPYLYGTINKSTNTNSPSSKNLRKATLEIYGMTCPSCADAVESLILQNQGVLHVKVDYYQRTCEIIYDPTIITLEEIIETIRPYTATIVNDTEL